MFKEEESRPDKIESTSNNVQARKKQQHRRRACDLLASLKRFYWPNTRIPMCLNRLLTCYVPCQTLLHLNVTTLLLLLKGAFSHHSCILVGVNMLAVFISHCFGGTSKYDAICCFFIFRHETFF